MLNCPVVCLPFDICISEHVPAVGTGPVHFVIGVRLRDAEVLAAA
jgi:hypothetical protein